MEDRALVARLKGLVTTMPDEPTKRACLEALRWLFATADLFQCKAPGGEEHCWSWLRFCGQLSLPVGLLPA